MFKRFYIVVLLAGPFLVSCKNDDDASKGVIKLSSDEVSALLGIKDKEGIKIGEIESGPQGVKVKSISLKENDSTEVEIQDVELRITSPSKLVYAISYLKIGKLDILDWKSSQRAQAFAIVVEKPGDGFLSKLDSAVSSTRASGSLKTADLSCERLAIDRLDYATHSRENPTSVRLEDLSISQVTSDRIGELRLGRAAIGTTVAGKGLKVTNVDRRWADQILARVVTFQGAEASATTKPAIDGGATTKPLVDGAVATKPVIARIELPSMGKRILPLDSLEVTELNFAIGKSATGDQAPIRITSVHLDVQRNADGELAGVTGNVNVAISPIGLADTDGAKKVIHEFFASFNPQLEQSIAITTTLKMTVDSTKNQEETQIQSEAPGLITIALNGTTRGLANMIGQLIANRELRDDSMPAVLVLKLELRDNGLFAYLLSDRFEYHQEVRGILPSFIFLLQNAGDDERVRKELAVFMRAPGSIIFTAQCDDFAPSKGFFVSDGTRASAKTRIAFTGATPQAAALVPPPMDIKAAYLELKNEPDSEKAATWLVTHCLENLDTWLKAASAGDPSARTLVAACYMEGYGAQRNDAEALRLLQQSADAGDTLAARYLGDVNHIARGGKTDAEALRWYQIAAGAGDTVAMMKIGKLYDGYQYSQNETRYGVAKDYAQAMTWYRKAADAGNAEAMEQVAEFYSSGKGVEVNPTEAFNWYFRAANAGRKSSIFQIAGYYETGKGVAPNMAEARRWYQKGADAGDRWAKEWLTKHPN